MMRIWEKGVLIYNGLGVAEGFSAGYLSSGGAALEVLDTNEVRIRKALKVDGCVDIGGNVIAEGNLSCNGDGYVRGTLQVDALTTPSDRRLKKEISPIHGALQKMMRVNPKSYFLKDAQADVSTIWKAWTYPSGTKQ